MTKVYILDTETTDKTDGEVIEIAYGEVTGANFMIEDKIYSQRYKPLKQSKWGAMAVHHILPFELEEMPVSSQVTLPIADYWIGHNIDFDWKVLGSPPVKRICTLALARALWPECDSHTQSALMYFLAGPTELTRTRLRTAHSAAADILICWQILQEILKKTRIDSVEKLWDRSELARIPAVMTFGKYKDQPISAVDGGWIAWYKRQPDTDPYLLEAFRRAGKMGRY